MTIVSQSFAQEPSNTLTGNHYASSQQKTYENVSRDNIYVRTPQEQDIRTATVVDYAQPSPNSDSSPMRLPFSTLAIDPCGDGSSQFTLESQGVRWRNFPVTYAIDTINSGVDSTAARNAVIDVFEEFDKYIPGQAFSLTSDFNAAKIKFKWEFIDGPFNQAGFASYSFTLPDRTLTAATITLDSGENWFVSPIDSCSSVGSSLDIQNVASHELGHAVGLGHVTDNLLTMHPTSFAGETLKRTLGTGDIVGMDFLYQSWSAWTYLGASARANADPVSSP